MTATHLKRRKALHSILHPRTSVHEHTQRLYWGSSPGPRKMEAKNRRFAFKDLNVYGFGSATDYQKSVGNVVLEGLLEPRRNSSEWRNHERLIFSRTSKAWSTMVRCWLSWDLRAADARRSSRQLLAKRMASMSTRNPVDQLPGN